MPALERIGAGALALHYAAARGCLDCVKLLVESAHGISANSQMDNDVTPVYLAAQEGHLDVLKYLVAQAGGSLYVRAKDGMAPVHAAAQMGCLHCLKWMVLEQGVDPNLRDEDGATPLHFAASRGHGDTVRWLLRNGARITLDKFGKSPVHDAAENRKLECLNILMQHGASPDLYLHKKRESRSGPKPRGCYCGETSDPEPQCCSSCPTLSISREPFYLHPPGPAATQDGLYVNPSHPASPKGSESFYLHNPREVPYSRVKDLFEPPLPCSALTVRVEVHSSSSERGSAENLSSSDLSSERSCRPREEPPHDYEDICQVRREADRSGAPSTDLEAIQILEDLIEKLDSEPQVASVSSSESGAGSGATSDPEEAGGASPPPRPPQHPSTLPLPHPARALKRVVSEPGGGALPPPPPPPLPEKQQPASMPASPPPEKQQPASMPAPPPPPPAEEVATPPPAEEAAASQPPAAPEDSEPAPPEGATPGDPELHSKTAQTLVNKQMVLPFVPPKFPGCGAASDSLIKPSEYLRSLGPAALLPQVAAPSPTSPTSPATSPPPPPPPPPPPAEEQAALRLQQPLGAISVQELQTVQLRRTEKTPASKTMSAPARTLAGGELPFQAQKEDLIAELKMSKDITGIKKLKVERAKVEEQQEKEMFTEITRTLTANSFVEKVPDKDSTGNPIPPWKRQMLAKKAAEKARRELEEQLQREAELKRLQSIPPWKRQLLAKKEETICSKPAVYTPKVVEDRKSTMAKAVVAAVKPEATEAPPPDDNKENSTPPQRDSEDSDHDSAPIMPWRAQLRKTNSKLSLLE